ncbi:OLC1v1002181C1 [Oldenlandia corymbosa var. corymbosa]|uniref:Pectinesterase n=1 Tax=Oldenlandia corymbosa var. corymbosa TaxID=529605 RepID=A0AAV1D744_OLDCO|nr:OLC1v1002181C1 [Oldenlandia corymbosa var. corymbosa]
METSISVLCLVLVALMFVSPVPISGVPSFCDSTPYPETCKSAYLSNTEYTKFPISSKSDFLKWSLKHTLDQSYKSWKNAYSLGPKCRNPREKVAWNDCVQLYGLILEKLNKTVDPTSGCTSEDRQTWLSSTLTYIETCKDSFHDIGITDNVMPLVHDQELANLICNNLAVNNGFYPAPAYTNGFPNWISRRDRKLLQSASPTANVVVAQDGSGNFKTVSAAVASAPGSGRYTIHVKAGTYSENVQVSKKNIMLIGDGIGKTIITGSKSVGGGSTTFNSATVGITGDGFIARGITFRNTAGAAKHQAVALRSGSDLSVFYQCSFEGFQDTLYVLSNRQFYRECDISGTVDFIFGNAAVVIQNCNLYAHNTPTHTNTLTAQGRTDPNQNTGISIHQCTVAAASDYQSSVKTYLGRPWKEYSRTVFMKTVLGSLIQPAGWYPWSGDFALKTLYYGEFANTGPGSSTANRVKWGGVHSNMSPADASKFTVGGLLGGGSWISASGAPFIAGL